MSTNNWIALSYKMPPKGEVVMISNGKSGSAQVLALARLQDGWLDPYEAEIEKERGEGEGKRLDGVWVAEMDDRMLVDFTPTHWQPMDYMHPDLT